jgi:HlyD family secretion protein
MKKINLILDFLKKYKVFFFILLVILAVSSLFIFGDKNGKDATLVAKIGEFTNQISVSGKVVPSSSVDLSFKNGGKIEKILYTLNGSDKVFVKAGTIIAQIESADARKKLSDALIGLENSKLLLKKYQVENSEQNLNNRLEKSFDNAFSAISDANIQILPAIKFLEDTLNDKSLSTSVVSNLNTVASYYRNEAERLYYKADNMFDKYQRDYSGINRYSDNSKIEENLNNIYEITKITSEALKSTKVLVDYLADKNDDDETYLNIKNSLAQYLSSINSNLSDLYIAKDSVNDSQDKFDNVDIDIKTLILDIRQKEGAIGEARENLDGYYIKAPFDGVITKLDAKVGEIVSPELPVVSMMSDGAFQIEGFVPEVSISLIKIGFTANVTLDAYGDSQIFKARVIHVDPAETMQDGVSTYKIKLAFDNQDPRILSGMTANVLIISSLKQGVIVLPKGVIYEKDGKKFVQIKKNKNIEEREISIGETSPIGQVEVIGGVNDGDIIILNPKI